MLMCNKNNEMLSDVLQENASETKIDCIRSNLAQFKATFDDPQKIHQAEHVYESLQKCRDIKTCKNKKQNLSRVEKDKRRGPRGGVAIPFPVKLHQLLDRGVHSNIISWAPHGRSFILHQQKEFVETVMSIYFRQTKLTSFQRQLNLYGFCRLTSGLDKGGYYHELFLQNKPSLCKHMLRIRIKGSCIKAKGRPRIEPNFYKMPPMKEGLSSGVKGCHFMLHPKVKALEPSHFESSFCSNVSTVNSYHSIQDPSKLVSSRDFYNKVINCSSSVTSNYVPISPLGQEETFERSSSPIPLKFNANSRTIISNCCDIPSNKLRLNIEYNSLLNKQCRDGDVMLFEGKPFHYLDPYDWRKEEGKKINIQNGPLPPVSRECIKSVRTVTMGSEDDIPFPNKKQDSYIGYVPY